MRTTIYLLKKQYGKAGIVRKVILGELDYDTGLRTIQNTDYELKKIIKLPDEVARSFYNMLEPFKYGGGMDKSITHFIIDKKEFYPTSVLLDIDYKVVFDEKVYNISEVTEIYNNQAFYVKAKSDE